MAVMVTDGRPILMFSAREIDLSDPTNPIDRPDKSKSLSSIASVPQFSG
jgi:hypothetical protein